MLLFGAISAVAIFTFTYGAKGYDNWREARATTTAAKRKLNELDRDQNRQAALAAIVPVFEAPQVEDKQKFLFRDRLHEQFKKAGINTEPLQFLRMSPRRPRNVPYRVLKIRCRGQCKLDQLLDFLANLKENPYCVGVEELRFQYDVKVPPEQRKDKNVDFELVVSTFVR